MALTREGWRQQWLASINELTDLELQRWSWLDRSKRNPHWSYVEFMCVYFDDVLCDYPYHQYVEDGWVSPEECAIVSAWHEALDAYEEPTPDLDDAAILNDPAWLRIVKAGEAAKGRLAVLLSGDERETLTEVVDHRRFP